MAHEELCQTKSLHIYRYLQIEMLCTDHGPRGASEDLGDWPGVWVAEVKYYIWEVQCVI